MNKVIRDGKVAVLYSPGYGAGWYSWHGIEELLFDPEVVKLVEKKNAINSKYRDAQDRNDVAAITSLIKQFDGLVAKIESYVAKTYKDKDGHGPYTGGADQLEIAWLDKGQQFEIEEYDGSEGINTPDNRDWIVA